MTKAERKMYAEAIENFEIFSNGYGRISGASAKATNIRLSKSDGMLTATVTLFNGDYEEKYHEVEYKLAFLVTTGFLKESISLNGLEKITLKKYLKQHILSTRYQDDRLLNLLVDKDVLYKMDAERLLPEDDGEIPCYHYELTAIGGVVVEKLNLLKKIEV